MKRHLVFLLGFVLNVSFCFAHHLAVVVNQANSLTNISSTHLARVYKAETKKWPDGTEVVLVLHKASRGEMLTLQKLINIPDSDLKARLKDHKNVILVDSDNDVLDTVNSTSGAIGLLDVRSINNKVKVVKVDGKLPMEQGYLPD